MGAGGELKDLTSSLVLVMLRHCRNSKHNIMLYVGIGRRRVTDFCYKHTQN